MPTSPTGGAVTTKNLPQIAKYVYGPTREVRMVFLAEAGAFQALSTSHE
jgi:hypothetical protein